MDKSKLFIIIGSIIIALVVVGLGIYYFSNYSQEQTTIDSKGELMKFCSTEEQCVDFLESEGMPEGYLESNNIKISCSGGACYAQK